MKKFSVLTPPDFELQFRAIGMLKGIISEINSNQATLTVGQDETYPIRVGGTFRNKILNKPQLKFELPGKEMVWKGYPWTNFQGELLSFQLINFHVPDSALLEEVDYFSIRGLIERISTYKKNIQVEIKSNLPAYNSRAFIIALFGEQPEALPGQFWEFLVKRDGSHLIVETGKCIAADYQTEIGNKEYKEVRNKLFLTSDNKRTTSDVSLSDRLPTPHSREDKQPIAVKSNQTQPTDNVIMIPGKTPEITIKFSTRPELPEQGQKVTLQVNSDNGISVRTTLNRKTLKKQVEKMDSFPEWVGVLSGKMTRIGEDGVIELEGAGVTVFEKKAKPTETEDRLETN